MTVNSHGTQRWTDVNFELHRNGDLPAAIFFDGAQHWYQHGTFHRESNLPAVIRADGLQAWYQYDICTKRLYVTHCQDDSLRFQLMTTQWHVTHKWMQMGAYTLGTDIAIGVTLFL